METADNSFGRRIHPTSVQISVEGLGTQCESILKRINLRPCRVSSRPKDSRGTGTPLRPELPCYDPYSPLRPETTNAGSGRSLAQQVFDVFLPSRRSDEVRCATDPASLEQTCSVSFL